MSIFKPNGAPPSIGIAKDIAKAKARSESLEKQLTTARTALDRAVELRRRALIDGTEQFTISETEEGVRQAQSVVEGLDDVLTFIRKDVAQLEERLKVAREREERAQKAAAIEAKITEIEVLRRELAKGAALMAKAAAHLVKAIPSEVQVEPVNAIGDPALLVARAFVVEAIAAAVEYWELLHGDAMVMVGRKLIGEELVNTPGRAQERHVALISDALIALLTRKVKSLRTPQAGPRAVA